VGPSAGLNVSEKIKFIFPAGIQNTYRPARSLVALPTALK